MKWPKSVEKVDSGGRLGLPRQNGSLDPPVGRSIPSPHSKNRGDAPAQSVFMQCNLPCSKVIIVQIYRPPNTCSTLFIEELSSILDTITESNCSIIIAGDFNFDLLDIESDVNANVFSNLLSSYSFLSSVSLPTRQSSISLATEQKDAKLSLSDYIYCNNITSVCNSGVVHDDLSEHFDRDRSGHRPWRRLWC